MPIKAANILPLLDTRKRIRRQHDLRIPECLEPARARISETTFVVIQAEDESLE